MTLRDGKVRQEIPRRQAPFGTVSRLCKRTSNAFISQGNTVFLPQLEVRSPAGVTWLCLHLAPGCPTFRPRLQKGTSPSHGTFKSSWVSALCLSSVSGGQSRFTPFGADPSVLPAERLPLACLRWRHCTLESLKWGCHSLPGLEVLLLFFFFIVPVS